MSAILILQAEYICVKKNIFVRSGGLCADDNCMFVAVRKKILIRPKSQVRFHVET
jgi:hypothetical protein